MPNKCIKNLRKKWWGTSYGPHKRFLHSIRQFMSGIDNYTLYYECVRCGAEWEEHFVKHADLVFMKIPLEDIEKASTWVGRMGGSKWYEKPEMEATNADS